MKARFFSVSVLALLALAAASGCIGGDRKDGSGIPVAFFTVTPDPDGVSFLFDAGNSSDPDGGPLAVQWNFGDGGMENGTLADSGLIIYQYAITDTSVYVTLVVTDEDGNSNYDIHEVSIGTGLNSAPAPMIKNATRWVKSGGSVFLDASRSTDADGDLFTYEWFLGNYTATPAEDTAFDTGMLGKGQTFNQTFNTPGVYLFHCHPHPWMMGRIIVDGTNPNATTGNVNVDIVSFAYDKPTTVVAPGATVSFRNLDPAEHTATIQRFAPGERVSTTPSLSRKLADGEYLAVLVLNDLKGGISTATWGLKASSDAPASPLLVTYPIPDGDNVPNVRPYGTQYYPATGHKAGHDGNLTAQIAWEDPAQQNQVQWRMAIVDSLKQKVLSGCILDGTTCTASTNVAPDQTIYFRITVSGPVVQDAPTLDVTVTQWTKPGFGDSDTPVCPPGTHYHHGACH